MKTDVSISCTCGRLQGRARALSAASTNRVICYCEDCQAFAEYLGRADEILDSHGGTDICQTSPASLEFLEGTESLACVRLTPKGALRWYARCCNTPIGNTLPTPKLPFVGLIHACLVLEDRSLIDVVGPVRAGVNGRYARGDKAEINAHDSASRALLFRVFFKLFAWRLRGHHKRTPFFAADGKPVVQPIRNYV